jgi:hypothetical protein
MEVCLDRVAGLDVGKESVTVCLRTPARGVDGHSEGRARSITMSGFVAW